MTQFGRNLRDRLLRPHFHHLRRGKNLGRTGEHRPAESLLDDAVVLYIPVSKKSNHHQRHRKKSEQSKTHDGIAGKQPVLPPLTTASSCRDFQLNGHGQSSASCTRAIVSPKPI